MPTPNTLINELEEALANGTADRRVKALQRITDLFVLGSEHFSDDHVMVFDGVLRHLIADVEVFARAALAERLAIIPNAPPTVIRTLAFDDVIEVASPVLVKSERLDNATLVENASTKSQRHLLAISRRRSLPETVTDVLVERGNREVALSTVRNTGAKFSEVGYVRLVKRSEGDDELAQSVGSRSEIPRSQFLKLLAKASQSVRRKLEAAHPEHVEHIRDVVAEVVTGIQVADVSHDYATARTLVESMHAAGKLGEHAIEAFARALKFEETTAALAFLCALPIPVVERAIMQDRVETILIMAKALGFSWLTAKSILLLRAGNYGMSRQSLEHCMIDFSRLKRKTAQRVLDFQRNRHLSLHQKPKTD